MGNQVVDLEVSIFGDATLDEIQQWAAHFSCRVAKFGNHYTFMTTNPHEMFWLGHHMGFRKQNGISFSEPLKGLSVAERARGRSREYYLMNPQQQWEEDKTLGLLDWNGK